MHSITRHAQCQWFMEPSAKTPESGRSLGRSGVTVVFFGLRRTISNTFHVSNENMSDARMVELRHDDLQSRQRHVTKYETAGAIRFLISAI